MARFASYDGTRISYRALGDAPPLVCLPGGPGRAREYLVGDLGGRAAMACCSAVSAVAWCPAERVHPLKPSATDGNLACAGHFGMHGTLCHLRQLATHGTLPECRRAADRL